MHFGRKTEKTYQLLESAFHLIEAAKYVAPEGFKNIIDRYREQDMLIDQQYRKFYSSYDAMEETGAFEPLRSLVENIYTNEYLAKLLPKWNEGIQEESALSEILLQRDFYRRHISNIKERTVVIISDAMRYEVAQELFRSMQDDPKCTAKMDVQLSVLPSFTRLGMASLLPHDTLTMTDDFRVLADDIFLRAVEPHRAFQRKRLKRHHHGVDIGLCVANLDVEGGSHLLLGHVVETHVDVGIVNPCVYVAQSQVELGTGDPHVGHLAVVPGGGQLQGHIQRRGDSVDAVVNHVEPAEGYLGVDVKLAEVQRVEVADAELGVEGHLRISVGLSQRAVVQYRNEVFQW
ncbi:MAG: PglZ domain-containing protein [Prevotella sp.]